MKIIITTNNIEIALAALLAIGKVRPKVIAGGEPYSLATEVLFQDLETDDAVSIIKIVGEFDEQS